MRIQQRSWLTSRRLSSISEQLSRCRRSYWLIMIILSNYAFVKFIFSFDRYFLFYYEVRLFKNSRPEIDPGLPLISLQNTLLLYFSCKAHNISRTYLMFFKNVYITFISMIITLSFTILQF